MESFSDEQLVDLIQYAIEEGTGEPCTVTDAESIFRDWKHFC